MSQGRQAPLGGSDGLATPNSPVRREAVQGERPAVVPFPGGQEPEVIFSIILYSSEYP